MQVEWYGQSAFRLTDGETTVFIDPFDMAGAKDRGVRWDYPDISGVEADVLLVTHEHMDHNGVGAIDGDPLTLRSTAGSLESPIGDVVGVASEHDEVAGSVRGANVIYAFTFGGRHLAHLGDLGQSALRPEQLEALGTFDLVFVPVGGGPTIDAARAHKTAAELGANVIIPMHYKTERIDFLETVEAFVANSARSERLPTPVIELDDLPEGDTPLVAVPAAP